jgi:hypothetical protein
MVGSRAPGAEDAADAAEQRSEVGGLLFEQRADMNARRGAFATECDDMLNLAERQAHAASLADEREQPQHVDRVAAIARRRPLRWRQNPSGFVQPQRFAAQAAP